MPLTRSKLGKSRAGDLKRIPSDILASVFIETLDDGHGGTDARDAAEATATQIEGIIIRTARPLPGGSFTWHKGAGFGRIDPNARIQEEAAINDRKDKT